MFELVGKFVDFIGSVLTLFWTSFFHKPGDLFVKVAEEPLSSFFEILFILFLLGTAVTVVLGILGGVRRRSPWPLINAIEVFTRFFGLVGAWIIAVLIVAMVYEVISRYFLNAPTKWAFEMAYMLMGTSFMFAIAYCMQMRRHVRVDFVYDHLGLKARAVIDLVGFVIMMPMILWLCAGLWGYFQQAYVVNEMTGESAWNPIVWPFKFTYVVGFVLILLQTIAEMLKAILILAGREVPAPASAEGLQ